MLRPGGTQHQRETRSLRHITSWALWKEPGAVGCYVVGLTTLWTGALAAGLLTTDASATDLLTFALLVACGSVALEATKRQGEPAGVAAKDLLSAWYLPIAYTLPPVYSLLAPIPFLVVTHLRVQQTGLFKRVFSVASIGLSNWLAAAAFHGFSASWSVDLAPGVDALVWTAAALVFAVTSALVSATLVAIAVKASSPEATLRGQIFNRDSLTIDWGEVCIGVILALVCMLNPLLALVALTPVVLLQRTLLHDQLEAAARHDAKTELLNGPAWEREVDAEIARAVRTRSPLSVLLIDLDHLKQVNDFFGHLVGDAVIRGVADVLRAQTRDYDQCARFGGDEFAVLLPQSDAAEAHRTADRIRKHIEALAVPAGERFVAVSASAGVAELTAAGQDVTDLLAAADVELYRAKRQRRPAPTAAWDLEKH
jgi:diguanylate cyclase (GGDEF)-like protein